MRNFRILPNQALHQLAMEVSKFATVRRLVSVNQRRSHNGAESS